VFHQSPKGRRIERVEGTPGDIIARGDAIESLGKQMRHSAETLQKIKSAEVGDGTQKGKAIESLKDSIGDAHETLLEAADLYEPVGPVISAYGSALEGLQPGINSDADEAEEKWQYYLSLPGDKDGSTTPEADGGFLGLGGHDADSQEAKDEAADNQAKKDAYEAWEEVADSWDAGYDSWEDAFETACNGVEEKVSGKIKDSIWSTFADILGWVALVVGVVALIIGGPILAALALAVGAVFLFVTIMAYKNGERSATDIALAALSVLPVGKIAPLSKLSHIFKSADKLKVFKAASGLKGLDGLTKATSKLWNNGTLLNKGGLAAIYKNHGAAAAVRQLLTGSRTGYTQFARGHKAFYEGAEASLAAMRNGRFVSTTARIDQIATLVSTTLRNYGYVDRGDKLFGGDAHVPNIPKQVGFVF
jgi:hypothetical protein